MMGDLFIARNVQPPVLDAMTLTRMSYWHRWHEIADKHEDDRNKREEARRKLYHPDA